MTPEIEREVERYMAMPYRIELTPDEDGWVVSIPDLPYCISQGGTVDEAMEMIRDAQRSWLVVALSHEDSIPEPRAEPAYSGKFMLRVPPTLHRDLAEGAEHQKVSLNQYVLTLLARGTVQASVSTEIEERLADLQTRLTALQETVERSLTPQAQNMFAMTEEQSLVYGIPSDWHSSQFRFGYDLGGLPSAQAGPALQLGGLSSFVRHGTAETLVKTVSGQAPALLSELDAKASA